MMDFAKTIKKNNRSGDSTLQKQVLALLVVYVILIVASKWVVTWYEPEVEGRLAKVKDIVSLGEYKLNGVKGLALDEAGYIYAVDSRNDRVIRYAPKGWVSDIIGEDQAEGEQKIKNATSVTTHKGKVYVGSYGTSKVLVYNLKGKLLDVLPHSEDTEHLAKIYPLAMTTDQGGNLYVADGKAHQIIVFEPSGKLKMIFGEAGSLEGQMKYVNGIAVDNERQRVIVLDSGNTRIQMFNLQGKFLQQIYVEENGRSLLVAPRGLAYNPQSGEIYVTEPVLDKVFVINDRGMVVARSGKVGLNYPTGIAVNPKGHAYVSNRETGMLTVLNP